MLNGANKRNYLSLQKFYLMRIFICILFFVFFANISQSQTVLLWEDFNGCALPSTWTVNINGNPNAVWYVDTLKNDDGLGESIDGSCCLIIDDDATGDNTPAFVWEAISPVFDASKYPTIQLDMDVHYRDWNEAEEFLEVFVTDGTTEYKIGRFDQFRTNGGQLSDHFDLRYDLALLTNASQVRLIFRYNDAGGFGWWAAFDNVAVVGFGEGTNVVRETFNGCTQPAGWETEVLTGDQDWTFGVVTAGAALNGGVNSMDGTCFAFFDDDILGEDEPFSAVRLYSPWFDGTDFAKFTVEFDVIMRYYSEKIALYVQHADGTEFLVSEAQGDVGGPFWDDYLHAALDISQYRAPQMRVVFEYDDGQDWGWWAGFDNIKVTGNGEANDICTKATTLVTGADCKVADNLTALLEGPNPACTGKASTGLWYTWQADFGGVGRVELFSQYNAVVEVFTGTCDNLQPVLCYNRDEHGFYGEWMHFAAQNAQKYLFRVSNIESGFGARRGYMCTAVKQATGFPVLPSNDLCANATDLAVNGPCTPGYNYFTEITQIPTLNERARADVWYKFTAPALAANELLEFTSNANFSDIITLYSGGCSGLNEIASNHYGASLKLPALVTGQTYFVQVAGNFATIEGGLCAQMVRKTANAPTNDLCSSAASVTLGNSCSAGNNEHAGFSGKTPSCVVSVERDVWFKFTAPTSGAVQLNSGASFQHVMAVWSGSCGDLQQVFCAENPTRCEGYKTVGSLTPGQVYFVQIAAQVGITGSNFGDICLKILDGNTAADYTPMSLQVVESCNGNNLATLQVSVAGGALPYTYEGAVNGQTVTSGESYLCIVKDAAGCERSFYAVTKACDGAVTCALTAGLTAIQPTCPGSSNGSLQAIVVGGPAPYTYLWSNGSTQELNSGIGGGTYSLTVTDAVGCSSIATDTLVNPAALSAVPTSILQPGQGLSDGAIFLDIAGGSGTYTYAWSRNGVFLVASEDLTNAAAGDYVLVVTDGNNCTASFSFTLTETVGSQTPTEDVFAEVFPNPAKDKATLSLSLPTPQAVQVSLCDAQGRGLRTWHFDRVSEQNLPLEIRDLPSGAYQVRILLADTALTRTLVIGAW
jgi:hypothetical protein